MSIPIYLLEDYIKEIEVLIDQINNCPTDYVIANCRLCRWKVIAFLEKVRGE